MRTDTKRALFYAQFEPSDDRREDFCNLARDLYLAGWEIYTVGTGARNAFASASVLGEQVPVRGLLNDDDVALSQQVHRGLTRRIGLSSQRQTRQGVVRFDLLCVALSRVDDYIAAREDSRIVREVYGDARGTALITTAAMGGRVLIAADVVDYVGVGRWIQSGMTNKSEVATVLAHKALGIAARHLLACGSYRAEAVCAGEVRVGHVRWDSRRPVVAR